MKKTNDLKPCMSNHPDCFANKSGICICLSDTDFHGRDCSFYATSEQVEERRRRSHDRLISIGAFDLIQKYGGKS